MKNIFTILLLLSSFACHSQTNTDRLKGFWQNTEEESVIDYFNGRTSLSFLYSKGKGSFSGGKYPSRIGFYNSCEVPSIDSLMTSGTYFFAIDEDEIHEDGSIKDYDCLELSFYEEAWVEYKTIYRSSQQQFSTYRRIKKLPKNLEEYLEKDHPEIYREYSNL